jgi:hypothetical protein
MFLHLQIAEHFSHAKDNLIKKLLQTFLDGPKPRDWKNKIKQNNTA